MTYGQALRAAETAAKRSGEGRYIARYGTGFVYCSEREYDTWYADVEPVDYVPPHGLPTWHRSVG